MPPRWSAAPHHSWCLGTDTAYTLSMRAAFSLYVVPSCRPLKLRTRLLPAIPLHFRPPRHACRPQLYRICDTQYWVGLVLQISAAVGDRTTCRSVAAGLLCSRLPHSAPAAAAAALALIRTRRVQQTQASPLAGRIAAAVAGSAL